MQNYFCKNEWTASHVAKLCLQSVNYIFHEIKILANLRNLYPKKYLHCTVLCIALLAFLIILSAIVVSSTFFSILMQE